MKSESLEPPRLGPEESAKKPEQPRPVEAEMSVDTAAALQEIFSFKDRQVEQTAREFEQDGQDAAAVLAGQPDTTLTAEEQEAMKAVTAEASLFVEAYRRKAKKVLGKLDRSDRIADIKLELESKPKSGVSSAERLAASIEARGGDRESERAKENIERARRLAEKLDEYVERRMPELIDDMVEAAKAKAKKKGLEFSPDQARAIATATIGRVERAKEFFSTVDGGKRENTPLERMAASYEALLDAKDGAPTDQETIAALQQAIDDHMEALVGLAFDQHVENPEQYVSHGFDHSLGVADYARQIIEQNPVVVEQTVEKYGVTPGEAKFMLEQVALLHDCGYPHVGDRAKAVHGIAGADIVSSPKMQAIFDRLITSPGAKKDKLKHDFRDSILFHSADKVEQLFGAKVETTRGTFLIDSKNVVEVLSVFNDPDKNEEGIPREVTEIFVSSIEMQREIEEALRLAGLDTKRKTGTEPEKVKVTVIARGLDESGPAFRGRFADLQKNKDKKLGLEFSQADAKDVPLHSLIRLADNMDMRSNRFSPTQREPAFRDAYMAMGDARRVEGQMMVFMEKLTKSDEEAVKEKRAPASAAELQAKIRSKLQELKFEGVADDEITSLDTSDKAEKWWKRRIIERALAGYPELSEEKRKDILKIAMTANSESVRHFGGCEAVRGVELVSKGGKPVVKVKVDRAKFEELNGIRVMESSKELKDGKVTEPKFEIGVGEYQAWRALEAYRSILVDGQSVEVQVVVVDEEGQETRLAMTHRLLPAEFERRTY